VKFPCLQARSVLLPSVKMVDLAILKPLDVTAHQNGQEITVKLLQMASFVQIRTAIAVIMGGAISYQAVAFVQLDGQVSIVKYQQTLVSRAANTHVKTVDFVRWIRRGAYVPMVGLATFVKFQHEDLSAKHHIVTAPIMGTVINQQVIAFVLDIGE